MHNYEEVAFWLFGIGILIIAAHAIWMHYRFFKRDFSNDLFYAITKGIDPVAKDLSSFLRSTEKEILSLKNQFESDLARQKEMIDHQERLIRQNESMMDRNSFAFNKRLSDLENEKLALKKEIAKYKAIADRLSKKENIQ